MHTLSNETLAIKVDAKGAELLSIYNNQSNLEYIWSAQPVWPKTSPTLFPVVGALKNGKYSFEGKDYSLPRHGFARDHYFELEEQTATSLTFRLDASDQTRAVYPFEFTFKVVYTLHGTRLSVSFVVENTGSGEMYFSVGAHPAFAVPLQQGLTYDDYFLQFDENETAPRWPILENGVISDTPVSLLQDTDRLPLRKDLFERDAIVFKDLESTSISLVSDRSPHGVSLSFEGFPYMGIWAAKGADFVCIEPWCGLADTEAATGNLNEKEGIMTIAKGEKWERSYSITVF
jgi:galactose mutarotase-like enzyme